MADQVWYMASGTRNQTGPIEKDPGKAAKGFFEQYPTETKCYINAGDRLSGTDMFFAHVGKGQFEMTKDMVTGS